MNDQDQIDDQRRSWLKKVGLGALSVVGTTAALTSSTLAADATTKKAVSSGSRIMGSYSRPVMVPLTDIEMLASQGINFTDKLGPLKRSQLKAIGLPSQRLPGSTSITDMGLDERAIANFSDEVLDLTKRDLELLGRGRLTPAARDLNIIDLRTVQNAFGAGYDPINNVAISCCCCTPCCCAVATENPQLAA